MNSTAARWTILALTIALAYLIGAGTWSTPTTAVGTVAHASSAPADPIRVVVEVAPQPDVAAPRPDTTELAALLAAEDELAAVSSTVVARATERAERKATTPAKVASVTAPAKAEQKADEAAEKAAAKAEKAEQKATAKAAKAADAKRKAAAKAAAKAATEAGGQVYGAPITDAAWDELQASGWEGHADGAEALYQP